MHANIKAVLILGIPLALTLGDTAASARKKRHRAAEEASAPTPKEEAPAATPAPSPAPDPPAAAPAPAASSPAPDPSPVAATSPAPEPPPVVVAPPPPPPPPSRPKDGVRFRGGISLGGGGEFISGFTAGLGAIDGRLGVQINNLAAVYLQPHVAFGAGSIGSFSGPTGSAAATVMVDFTFIDRIFVGAGGGFGIVNNPYGAVAQLRFGGYPVIRVAENRPRRKGLMVGADTRIYFTQVGPVLELIASVGYEAF